MRFSVKAKHWERAVRLKSIGFTKEIINSRLRENAENRYRLFTLEYKPPYRSKRFPLEDELRKLDFAIDHNYDAAAVLVDTIFYLVITVIQIVAELADVMLLLPDLRASEKDLKELVADSHFLKENDIHTVSDLQINIEQSRSELSTLERERNNISNRIRRPKLPEEQAENKELRKAISKQTKPVRERLRRAERILEKSSHLYELLKQEHELEKKPARDTEKEVDKMKNTRNQPVNIPVSKLRPFEGHPFKVKDDEEMNTLIESVQTQGILSPLIVRPIENTDEYEVISGHRRLHATVKAGVSEVPALIYALDRDAAAIAVVDSNLHREHILPSEKAFAYKLKMEALSHQGTSRQLGEKWSVSQISKSANESERQIHRYIRLTHLIPELLTLMDENKMALSIGVELSFLDEQSQYDVLEQCEINDCTPSYAQAVRMRKAFSNFALTADMIRSIMSEEKANQRETVKIPTEKLRKFAPDADPRQLEDFVLKACEHYRKYLRRQRENER